MTEQGKDRPFEEKLAVIDSWIEVVASQGLVNEIEPEILKDVLTEFGADLEPREELSPLAKYSNKARRPGMDAVWGKEKVNAYKKWISQYVVDYEIKTGRDLPVLEGTSIKTSGMMQFFGELTALAAGKMDFEDYKRLTEDRARKGQLWQEKDLNEPVNPSPHSSFPPGFPKAAWEQIKSWKRE